METNELHLAQDDEFGRENGNDDEARDVFEGGSVNDLELGHTYDNEQKREHESGDDEERGHEHLHRDSGQGHVHDHAHHHQHHERDNGHQHGHGYKHDHDHGHAHDHGHHHHGHHHGHEEEMTPEEVVRSLLALGEVALGSRDYESAAEAYASVLKLEQNETALYNMASFHARGVGVRKDFLEAARLFHQAELMGNARAGKLCAKCMLDYLDQGLSDRTSAEVYAAMALFVSRVYPEATERRAEVDRGLFSVGATHYNRGEFAEAAKAFRAAAEFGADGLAQNYLAVLYANGAGVEQNELAALYWFDCAVDNGAEDVALASRDEILAAYRRGLSAEEFRAAMLTLAAWCEEGTEDVLANPEKAARWRALADAGAGDLG